MLTPGKMSGYRIWEQFSQVNESKCMKTSGKNFDISFETRVSLGTYYALKRETDFLLCIAKLD